jgi:spore maturation protein CgeB
MQNAAESGRLLLVANPRLPHVGNYLAAAGRALGVDLYPFDLAQGFSGPWLASKLNWHLRGHLPNRLNAFGAEIVQACRELRPAFLLATGMAPLSAGALAAIGEMGIRRLNFLTDDPWNPAHRAPWFMQALSHYDTVFSPRTANLTDLRNHGVPQVVYMPFAYAPEVHFEQAPESAVEQEIYRADVAFIGGADRDRVPYISALLRAGIRVRLYGGYWGRYSATRPHSHGQATLEMVRKSASAACISLCLVRRANRDGNSMRTFELPAMGACILAEDTGEHRRIFGEDGGAVRYFSNIDEMLAKVRRLLNDPGERERLRACAKRLVLDGGHRYKDRLAAMLAHARHPEVTACA